MFKIINLLIFALGISQELEFKISHEITGYLFIIGTKSYKCSLPLDEVALQACTQSGYSKSNFVGNKDEYIQFINSHPGLVYVIVITVKLKKILPILIKCLIVAYVQKIPSLI